MKKRESRKAMLRKARAMLQLLEKNIARLKPIPTFSEMLAGATIHPEPKVLGANQYDCAHCHGIFELGPDEEPRKEFAKNFPGERIEDAARICHDCFLKFNKWMGKMEKTN